MSISSTSGSGRWFTRSRHLDAARSLPLLARCARLSSDGVAEPSTTRRLRQLGPHHGDIARVVARTSLPACSCESCSSSTMIRPRSRHRRKDGRARADHDARLAAPDAMPLLGALFRRERGVQQRDFVAEGAMELRRRRGRQADLRHQQNGGPARARARAASRPCRPRFCLSR